MKLITEYLLSKTNAHQISIDEDSTTDDLVKWVKSKGVVMIINQFIPHDQTKNEPICVRMGDLFSLQIFKDNSFRQVTRIPSKQWQFRWSDNDPYLNRMKHKPISFDNIVEIMTDIIDKEIKDVNIYINDSYERI